MVSYFRGFDIRPTHEVLKEAFDLLFGYSGEKQTDLEKYWYRTIQFPDGEIRQFDNESEFFFYYKEPINGALIKAELPSGASLQVNILGLSFSRALVNISLPIPEQAKNVLKVFTREEERLGIKKENKPAAGGSLEISPTEQRLSSPTIFIGHGGHDQEWHKLVLHLQREGFKNVIYYESGYRAGFTITDALNGMLSKADIAFLVHTGEDEVSDDSDEKASGIRRARENVIHEAGLFQGRLGFNRAIVLLERGCRKYSNISGLTHISFTKGKIEETYTEVSGAVRREFLP